MYRRVEADLDGNLAVRECDPVEVGAGMVRVAVEYCSVNRGDIERVRGSYGGLDATEMWVWPTDVERFVPGYEPVGTVVEAGAGVDADLVGKVVMLHSHEACGECQYCLAGLDNLCLKLRVFGVSTRHTGGWSEEIVVPATQLLVLRDDVDIRTGCTYEVTYGTALHALRRGLELAAVPGPIAVRGAPGALAIATAQFCVYLGVPCAAIVRDPSSDRVRQLRELLPEVVIVGEHNGRRDFVRAVGAPAAVVIEPLGGAYLAEDMRLTARGGAIGVIGAHVGATSTIRTDQLFFQAMSIYGSQRAPLETMVEVADMVAEGRIVPVIDRVFSMGDIEAALAYCDHPTGIGRVLLSMQR